MRREADELATPLNPIFSGVVHNVEYKMAVKQRENNAKYNRDNAKILDYCWKCPRFGVASIIKTKDRTYCQKCREALLKAVEEKEKKRV